MSSINTASGVIQVTPIKNQHFKFKEIIYIAILLRSNKSQFKIMDWPTELTNHNPIESNFKQFTIYKKQWLTEAKIFIIPTLTFGKTTIEIDLNEHPLFGTGFNVELYYRSGITKKYFNTTREITTSMGGSIKTEIQWNNLNKTKKPIINFKNRN